MDIEKQWTETDPRPRSELLAVIERLTRERDEARLLVTEANNSLYGSQGYFHSLDGGEFDKHHLSRGIENLKAGSNKRWRELVKAQQERDIAQENTDAVIEDYNDVRDKLAKTREAFAAAARFIDAHVADPDITDEMAKAYSEFLVARAALAPVAGEKS